MDRTLGNTGGLGGVFGLFYAVGAGLPFPRHNRGRKVNVIDFYVVRELSEEGEK